MALTIKQFWLVLMILGGLSVGCHSNDPDPKQVQYRVVKASETAFDLEISMTYGYDSLGRLSVVKEYPSVADTLVKITPTAQTVIYYNAAKPAQIDYVDRQLTNQTTDADGLVAGYRRTYSYDNQGRVFYISESKALNDFTKFKFTQALQYEYGTGNLPGQLIVSGPAPLLEQDIYTYTFTNGNAVHYQTSITSARSSKPSVTESDIVFDSSPNIFYNFFAVYPGITSFNKNNIIDKNATLVYDAQGLLVKRVKIGNYINDVTIYTYEPY